MTGLVSLHQHYSSSETHTDPRVHEEAVLEIHDLAGILSITLTKEVRESASYESVG